MFGSPFQPVSQPRLEPIDRFARGDALDLNADEPAIDVEVGLRHHGTLDRRIGVPGQPDPGVQHRSVRQPAEPTDLGPRVLGRTDGDPVPTDFHLHPRSTLLCANEPGVPCNGMCSATAVLCTCCRAGWAPVNADPLPPTARPPLEDVVRWAA